MLKQILFLLLGVVLLPIGMQAQKNDDPVLFTVGNTPVHLSEFKYIYTKTNGANADFSKKSLEEYLDLYVKFKLKVQKAKEMRLDTLPSLQAELAGYRRQLADSYLIDREVTDRLVKELYDRVQQDVDISHILIEIGEPGTVPSPEDTLKAYQEAQEIKKRLDKGEDFAKVAKEISDERQAKETGGRIGFINANMLPNGFYDLETAAYTTPVNKYSGVVRSRAGYHIVKVHARRPARGEVEIAHILVRVQDGNVDAAKAKIDSLQKELQKPGATFEKVAMAASEDELTAQREGYLGIFGIGRYEKSFEDAAFALEKDGQISQPVRTSIGWHLLKRISRRGIQPFDTEKNRLELKVKQDTRYEQARVAMLDKIRRENNFKENAATLQKFIAAQNDTFFTFKWRAPDVRSEEVLFTLGNTPTTLGDFTDYLGRSTGKRIRQKDDGVEKAVKSLYKEFLDETCLKYEEAQLDKKYPDFKALMREYEEGILLFEATKLLVWDKASQDSVGLEKFYETVKDRYKWEERAVMNNFKINVEGRPQASEIREYAINHTAEEVLNKYNTQEKNLVTVEERTMERKSNMNSMWNAGETGTLQLNRDGSATFSKVAKVLPPGLKTLKEARGYVIADYQDYLEKKWIEALQKQYQVNINTKVLNNLIKA
ncbi:MAG: peptidylprolyl isomerase [Saprospiraceae bacterium]